MKLFWKRTTHKKPHNRAIADNSQTIIMLLCVLGNSYVSETEKSNFNAQRVQP